MFPHETRILLFTMSCTQSTNKQHTGLWLELVFYKNPHHHNTAWLRGEKKSAVTSFEREAAILKKVHGFLQSFTNVVLFSVASLITFQCVFVFCPYDLATQTSSFRSSWIVLTYLQRLMWEWLLPWRHLSQRNENVDDNTPTVTNIICCTKRSGDKFPDVELWPCLDTWQSGLDINMP